ERIAEQIKSMIETGQTIPDDGEAPGTYVQRPVEAGDFLILVQRRSALFSEIIRACKARALPIAGADRLKVGAELAVKDLVATLSFLATPEDSLSLACALKSPLFGWSESALFTLAHYRDSKHLWPALRESRSNHPATMEILDDLIQQTDFLRPYDLIERILVKHHGRKRLLARLGPEAEDGINALLGQALGYEKTEIPSLTGFLAWLGSGELEIKRQMGAANGQIRVMTVHGAKGLEAPIVILPDTAPRRVATDPEIMDVNGVANWKTKTEDMPAAQIIARDAFQARQQDERQRLLYVALTRAEKWLIVAAAGDVETPQGCWYTQVRDAARRAGATEEAFAFGSGLRLSAPHWSSLTMAKPEDYETTKEGMPDFAYRSPPERTPPQQALVPSDLGGAKVMMNEIPSPGWDAMDRGTAIHQLIELFPGMDMDAQDAIALSVLTDIPDHMRAEVVAEARGVIDSPECAFLFADTALAEVPVAATMGSRSLYGVIDRVVVLHDRVIVVDFKSNAVVPKTAADIPVGILRQLGAYAVALGQIYPDRRIETGVVWTRTAEFMPVSHEDVTTALAHAPALDDALSRS
ncbi:MAG: 3'-5' exonuclease, partial [Pseudomonadota bacterium]